MNQIATQVHESITSKSERAIAAIMTALRAAGVAVIGCSYGKDSSCVLALTLEAVRRLKAEGVDMPVVVLTADTQVENPSMTRLAVRMSSAMLTFAEEHGLNVEQRWVTPAPADHYLVSMIGGHRIASVPGTKASCTMDLKIRPMDRARADLKAEFGAENILTLIGTRYEESQERGSAMRKRGESASKPLTQADGTTLLSPIADWALGDVWALLNSTDRQRSFPMLDYTPTLAVYETFGESTCSIGAIDPTFTQQSAGGCGSAGRSGCWACQRVTRDNSLEAMLDTNPGYAPLVRLSRTIRAGHYLPENRSYLARSITDGRIKVFANGYSAQWTAKLLKWALSVDAAEDDRAMRTGKARRFPRLLSEEHLMLIAFQWARYGLHRPGEFIRIYTAVVMNGQRYALPTDAELDAMTSRADTSLVGKDLGYLDTGLDTTDKPVFRDHWRDLLGGESACSVPVMEQPTGYRNTKGVLHDSLMYAEGIHADLEDMRNENGEFGITYMDFMWWYEMEFAEGRKSNAEELNWLLREGIIRARRGYQSKIAEYQRYSQCVAELGLENATLDDVIHHPAFTRAPTASTTGEAAPQADLFDMA
ncbi:MAG: phosphoadenosine phosphosulfate reductase [Marinobacter sp. T13-3]|nr:MAG: phosphoadenosine phosphosulfate reductase [Marinobacter sp. T13-3]